VFLLVESGFRGVRILEMWLIEMWVFRRQASNTLIASRGLSQSYRILCHCLCLSATLGLPPAQAALIQSPSVTALIRNGTILALTNRLTGEGCAAPAQATASLAAVHRASQPPLAVQSATETAAGNRVEQSADWPAEQARLRLRLEREAASGELTLTQNGELAARGLSGISCYTPRLMMMSITQGDFAVVDASQWLEKRYDDPEYKIPETVIIWGQNLPATCPDGFFGHWYVDLMKRGTELIVIDPRCTWIASRAKIWLQLRPGTDAALALGFIHVMIKENLIKMDFVEKWTNSPFLVRTDGKIPVFLKEKDIKPDGSELNFVAHDAVSGEFMVWDTTAQAYDKAGAKPSMDGAFTLTLVDGSKAEMPGDRTTAPTWIRRVSGSWLKSRALFLQAPMQMVHFLSSRKIHFSSI